MNSANFNTESLVLTLFDIGAVRLGQFKLHSGQLSPIYLDLRLLVSYPEALRQATAVYRAILEKLTFDRLVGTPLAGLPIGTAVALEMNRPLIYPRQRAKSYGTGKLIEGTWEKGETAVILDDLITSGDSILQTANILEEAGLNTSDAVVLIDRQQGGAQTVRQRNIALHAGITLSQALAILENNSRITARQRDEVLQTIDSSGEAKSDTNHTN